jgi:hypothetical protein
MTQCHPLFAQLLRPLVESHYEVQTNVAVGDAPRLADIVLVRRTAAGAPFQGLWRWLTTWNVLEFKGPTASARVDHLDDLVEVGLGIHRRLNEARSREKKAPVSREEVSLWYLANHLGKRFLASARGLLGELEELAAGVWRARLLLRPIILVSNRAVAVERDSLPVHLLTTEPEAKRQEVARVLDADLELLQTYEALAGVLDPEILEVLDRMGRKKTRGPVLNFWPVIHRIGGWREVLKQTGVEELAAELSKEQWRELLERGSLEEVVPELSEQKRQELLRLLQGSTRPEGRGRGRK